MEQLKRIYHNVVRGPQNPSGELSDDDDERGRYTPTSGTRRLRTPLEESIDAALASHSGSRSRFAERGSLSKSPRRDKPRIGPDIAVRQQVPRRTSQAKKLEEHRQSLYEERERLIGATSAMREENRRKMMKLRSLKERDNAEKYEDELFDMRLKELQSAQTLIPTDSPISEGEIKRQIGRLNKEIVDLAFTIAETAIWKDSPGELDTISKIIKVDLPKSFLESGNLEDKLVVEVFLRIFLSQFCTFFINSWDNERPEISDMFNQLYDCIRSEEEQMVAGKWRQIAFAQDPCRIDKKNMQEHTSYMISGVMRILSSSGWAAQPEEIQQRASKLMARAGKIRRYVKGEIISADCQPWFAAGGDGYDGSTMRDVAVDFGVETVQDSEGRRILGSTGLGLKIGGRVVLRTRIFLMESLRARHRRWTRAQTHDAVQMSDRARMEAVD